MARTQARDVSLLLLIIFVASINSVLAQDQNGVRDSAVSQVSPIKPMASVYPAPGGSVPMDSFHKKSQYIIVASKIIRPNTFYQVRLYNTPQFWWWVILFIIFNKAPMMPKDPKFVLKFDNMIWLGKYLVRILGQFTLNYSQSNFFDRGIISNLGA